MSMRFTRCLAALSAAIAVPTVVGPFDTARAEAPDGRYADLTPVCGSPCVKDTQTGLLWKQDLEAAWAYTYLDARRSCLAPWRLPTIRELQTIVDETNTLPPTIDQKFFKSSRIVVWSSSLAATSKTEQYWAVDFATGETAFVDATTTTPTAGVRCVQ